MRGLWRFCSPWAQVDFFFDQFLPEVAIDKFDAMPRVGGGKARPPDEILQSGWSMTGEITLRQFC
jgi:hypothetical protein